MADIYAALAGLTVLVHIAFVAFAVLGGLLVLRCAGVAWAHLPAAAWAVYIQWSGNICPLTPLENELRRRAGLDYYSGDFVAQYLFPVLYPDGLTRDAQITVGIVVLAINLAIYGWLTRRVVRGRGSSAAALPTQSRSGLYR